MKHKQSCSAFALVFLVSLLHCRSQVSIGAVLLIRTVLELASQRMAWEGGCNDQVMRCPGKPPRTSWARGPGLPASLNSVMSASACGTQELDCDACTAEVGGLVPCAINSPAKVPSIAPRLQHFLQGRFVSTGSLRTITMPLACRTLLPTRIALSSLP